MATSARVSCKWMLIALVALLVFCNGSTWHVQATTSAKDLRALQNLYNAWSGPSSSLSGWDGTDPCGDNWSGVTCNDMGQVTELKLVNLNLSGGIPNDVVNLEMLETLDLSFNPQLGGSIPEQIGLLTSLQSLSIMASGLTGSIPSSLGQCTQLTYLSLTQNKLSGTIPAELGSLINMTWFDISENQIGGVLPISTSSGSVGLGLDTLENCQHFHFNNNSLVGSIPLQIFNLKNLVHILFNANNFQGQLPSQLSNATGLQILRVDNNRLSGSLPSELNSLTGLVELHLSDNSFSGVLPDLSDLAKSLQLLDVSNNTKLQEQEVPSWVYNLDNLVTLNLDNCQLAGSLDSSIFELPAIQNVQLSNNKLNGTLSFSPDSPGSLVLIDLENNDFTDVTGFVSVNGQQSTVVPRLAGNPFCSTAQLNGTPECIPPQSELPFWNATSSNCKGCGSGKIANPNDCTCSVPLICSMQLTTPSFQTVNTSLIQNMESEFAGFYGLDDSQVYIGSANFTSDSRMLFDLQFFPHSGLVWSRDQVTNITTSLNPVSHNLAEGPYILRNFSLAASSGHSSKGGIGGGAIAGIIAGIVGAVLILGLIAGYAYLQKRRADHAEISRPFASWGASSGNPGEAPQLKGARWFSLAELRKATNNFDIDNEVGAGGYGKVYKGVLGSGAVVAVKRAEEGSMQGAQQFKNEIELLSRVHHKHLVGLVGFCYEQGEQMLVYEYIPNGTLRDHLLGHSELPLPWATRVSIALGSARGIAYLHDMANPPIIHRDIKSSNILLDENMVAKVSDFGLSKLAPDAADKNHVSTQVKGTLGYLDPEYYMTNQLSEKSDVYSFGVVLLELLSARQPIERGRYIVREVRTARDKGGMKAMEAILDPMLGNYPQKELGAVIELALRCVEERGEDRPTMDDVVRELEVIAGNSQPTSGVHITVEPQNKADDPYGGLHQNEDPSFQYSAAYMPGNVEPK